MFRLLFIILFFVIHSSVFSQEKVRNSRTYIKTNIGVNSVTYKSFTPNGLGLTTDVSFGIVTKLHKPLNFIYEGGVGYSHSTTKYQKGVLTDIFDVYNKYFHFKFYLQLGSKYWKYRAGLGYFTNLFKGSYRYRMYKDNQLQYDYTTDFIKTRILPAHSFMLGIERQITSKISVHIEGGNLSHSEFEYFYIQAGVVYYFKNY